MGVGSADYYLSQVARTASDYYLGHGEAPGYWLGAGAARLALTGDVTAEQLHHLIRGHHPRAGVRLLDRTYGRRRPGFDITFGAPKSASVLYALGDDATRGAVRAAHDAAVADAMGYLERVACKVRRGKGGVEQHDGGGFVSAAFRQRTSRAGDPHLHTQVVTANMALGPDGRWTALDGRLIYLHGKTAGMLYAASFRYRLARELGARWLMRSNGTAEMDGFPPGLLRRLSQRRQQVEDRMAERGESTASAAQVATLSTRQRKSEVPSVNELLPLWREAAAEAGFDRVAMMRMFGRGAPPTPGEVVTAEVFARLLGPEGLTEHRATFDRRDVVQALCKTLPTGGVVADVERLADALLRERDVIAILPRRDEQACGSLARDQAVCADGKPTGTPLATQPRYTTVDLLATEVAVLTRADSGRNARVGIAADGALDAAFARRPTLSDEQRVMIRRLTTSGAGVDVVVGKAGTGKTFALDAARDAWETSGMPVIGTTLAARAALELQHGSGIESMTVTRLLGQIDRHGGLPQGCVLVVDEAGMVGTRDLNRLVQAAADAGGKVVLVGDPHQLPEIDAGGIYRALIERLGAVELAENRRQIHPWERVALDELRHGDVSAAVEALDIGGSIVICDTAEQTRELLAAAWWADRQTWEAIPADSPDKQYLPLMRAYRRAEVADLNTRGRAYMAAHGRLSGPEVVTADGHRFAVGDSVMLLKNKYGHGLLNGDCGDVVAVDPYERRLVVQLDRGPVVVPAWYLDEGHVTYGYARTIHKSQAETGFRTRELDSDRMFREAAYTGLSRGRDRNVLYITAPSADENGRRPDPFKSLERRLSDSQAQRSVHDELAPAGGAGQHDFRRLTDEQLRARIDAGERVERNQPPDVRGRLTAVKNERDWLARRMDRDRARLAALQRESDQLGPLARGRRRELRARIEDIERATSSAAARVAVLDEETSLLTKAHAARLRWERATQPERDMAHAAMSEIESRREQPQRTDRHDRNGRGEGP
jgi:conjugative relaxase-like TrwC/TraI family protein